MAAKPGIVIVGVGNLGSALAVALRKANFPVSVFGRPGTRTRLVAARDAGARVVSNLGEASGQIVWFCVPDAETAKAGRSAATQIEWKGKIALHSSGALTSDELDALRRRGACVASVHPLMTFVRRSRPSLSGVPFAVEGDLKAVRAARRIVEELGGEAYAIRKRDKAAYHAWGTFASPLLTALLATAERVAGLAGVKRGEAARRMMPILMQTLANYAQFGAVNGFSGPIVRGDVETVRGHLRVLKKAAAAREVYVALAGAALEYLPAKHKRELRETLQLGGR